MTPEEQVVEDIKTFIATLPDTERAVIDVYATSFRRMVGGNDDAARAARLALALVGAEEASKN